MIDEKKLIEACRKKQHTGGNVFIESLEKLTEELLKTDEETRVSKMLPEPWGVRNEKT